MRTIGVISDTHGQLRPEALEALRGSDLILHAGDVGKLEILEALEAIAPTYAVFGNTDWGPVRGHLPHSQVIDLAAEDPRQANVPKDHPGQRLAYVLHIQEEIDLDLEAAGMQVVVFGHTHEPLVERRGSVLWLNPGSAGPRRFSLPVTVARLALDPADPESALLVEMVELGGG